jgi:basic membrane lipoprotein Med (substrate-binding protein (PBP1-ABC) superfamily)
VLLAGVDDQGWSAAHAKGIEQLRRELGRKWRFPLRKRCGHPHRPRPCSGSRPQGNRLIFGTTFQHMEPLAAVAAEHPGVAFMHCSGFKTRPTMGVYMARIEQGEYLAGTWPGSWVS